MGPDDFASMREIIYRRYRRLLDEGEELPQLIIVDGGKGQLSAALESIDALGLNGRYDGSSRFAKGNRWGFFPSASLGWNITREQFMMPIADVVSNLKLRASYGLLGNQAGAALYTFAATMDLNDKLGNYIFSDGRHIFTKAPAVVNPNTTWEKVESKNIGLDFGSLVIR